MRSLNETINNKKKIIDFILLINFNKIVIFYIFADKI